MSMPPDVSTSDTAGSVSTELRGAARGGAVTLVGAFFSTAMGFLLSLVLARQLGTVGSGVVLQAIAAFMIGLAFARLGMDTCAVWILPRLRQEDPGSVRGACVGLVSAALLAGAAGMLAWFAAVAVLGDGLLGDPRVADAVSVGIFALPAGAVMMVALAATRAFGGVIPFNAIGNIGVPLARPVGVLVVAALGGSVLAATLSCSLPLVPGALAALWVLSRQVKRFERRRSVAGAWLPTWPLQRRILGFALPRTWSSALEQSVKWLDVVLVGVIAGPAAAGIYGVASRFVAAGIVVLTALRIVVAPRFSAFLAQNRLQEVQHLYAVTAGWILLFGAPIYVLLAFYAETVLGWLGPGFSEGVPSLVVLCAGALVLLAGGNVQSLLLMSGRSGWGAVNKTTVFVVNVAGNLALVPLIGFFGAAISWASCMVLDTCLAVFQVRRFTGITPAAGRIGAVLLAVVLCVAAPSALMLWLLGDGLVSLVMATLASAVLLLGYCVADRRRLHLSELTALVPRRGR